MARSSGVHLPALSIGDHDRANESRPAAGSLAAGAVTLAFTLAAAGGGEVGRSLADNQDDRSRKEMENTKHFARRAYPFALATALHLFATGCDGDVEISVNITSPGPELPCGDGQIGPGEECDDGEANGNDAACKLDCTLNVCGDGHVGPGETCDDGNDVDDDGCSNTCVGSVCGDGVLQPGEACDDGNDVDDDACSNDCALAACGDGVVQVGEACDDGNSDDTDLCTVACVPASCGDEHLQPAAGEECDDGAGNGPRRATTATSPTRPSPDTPDLRPPRFLAQFGVWRGFSNSRLSPTDPDCGVATAGFQGLWQLHGIEYRCAVREAGPAHRRPVGGAAPPLET